MNKYMQEAIKEAKKALNKDVPVGAIIVENNKIIAKAHNKKEKKQIATYHAEILAINKACKKKKSWHLDNCEMYVTMEPCIMCIGAIKESRIKKIYFGIENDKYGYTKIKELKINNLEVEKNIETEKIKPIIQKFFKDKRK